MPGVTQSEVVLVIAACCELCKKSPGPRDRNLILLAMSPGPDGEPWYLCVPCWFDGLHPNSPRKDGSAVAASLPERDDRASDVEQAPAKRPRRARTA